MKQANITVLRKILYAVESGGQVYGNQNYKAFAGVGANTPNEKAITIGAGQWYAGEAKTLLQLIQKKYPATFKKLDTVGIATDLKKDWSTYGVTAASAKGKCIISIISSADGIKCQDALMEYQIKTYAESITKTYGSMSDDGMMECINIRHQGGASALKRILAKTTKPYTAETIYAALCTDPADKSSNNQVGDYTGRQKKVYEFITKYASMTTEKASSTGSGIKTVEEAICCVIGVAEEEIGYLEKASNSNLDSKTGNAGSGNYTKYWRDVYPQYQGSYWCAVFISWCFMKAFGLALAKKLLKHWPYVYCPTMSTLFTLHANPQKGDIVIFYRKGEFAHTGIVTKVSGDQFWTIEGNTSGASGVIANGGGVCEKSYYNSQLPGTKFCRPDYSLAIGTTASGSAGTTASTTAATTTTTTTTGGKYMFSVGNVQSGSTGNDVKLLQRLLKSNGFKGQDGKNLTIDGEAGANTVYAIKAYQKKKGLSVDGCAGPATWKSILLR